MLALIKKDILLLKKTLIFAFLYSFFAIVAFQHLENVFVLSIIAIVYILTLTVAAYEDKNKADVIFLSLPVRRRELVLAKYYSALVYMLFAVIRMFHSPSKYFN